jgi:hypothetical protein
MEDNNGTGFLPPPIKKEIIPLPEIPKAQTPVFDELMTKVYPFNRWVNDGKDQSIYYEYVKKLRNTYPKCNFKDTELEAKQSGNLGPFSVHQPFRASRGGNYYTLFRQVETKCFLQPYIEARENAEARQNSDIPGYTKGEIARLKTLSSLQSREGRLASLRMKQLSYMRKHINRMKQAEESRLRHIPKGNLLELNKLHEPNLLSFEPTKNGLNKRAKELEGLFGGRRTKKSRKTKKNNRVNRRKTYRRN